MGTKQAYWTLIVIILSSIALTQSLFAAPHPINGIVTMASKKEGKKKSVKKPASVSKSTKKKGKRKPVQVVIPKSKAKKYAKVAQTMKYSERCREEFVSEDGLGEWGKFVKRELASGQFQNLLTNTKAFKNVCPGFRTMSRDERKNLWVFILMSMSHYESSCRPQVEAQGPHGIAKGLLQLHEGAENRYAHWDRDRICKKGDSQNPKESLQCTLSMLDGQVERFNSIFFEGSYWDVLRNVKRPSTHAAKIKTAIQMLPGCGSRAVASNGGSFGPG
jgi:hypothetical protein